MPAELFDIDLKDLRNLQKFMKRAPKSFSFVTASVLNTFAFGTRKENLHILESKLTIRSQRFVKSRVRVEKARGNKPITSQRSEVGSISSDRFSGWVEQELGTPTKRTRISTVLARGGSVKKTVRPSVRLKPSNKFVDPDGFPGKQAEHRAWAMIAILARKGYRKPFVITGLPKIKSGLFKFNKGKSGQFKRLQTFNPRRSQLQPPRLKWLTGGSDRFFKRANIRQIWADALTRELLGKKKKLK